MKAQFKVTNIDQSSQSPVVTLVADHSNPGNPRNDVNNTYSNGDPKAELKITVDNQNEKSFFVQDKIYAVVITPA